jgi:hypothetical protein
MVIQYSLPARVFDSSRRTIVGQKSNAKMIALLCLFVIGPNVFAQIESGTVILIGYSKNKIIVAADSRMADEGKAPSDDKCKITALGNKIVFTAPDNRLRKTSRCRGAQRCVSVSLDIFAQKSSTPSDLATHS